MFLDPDLLELGYASKMVATTLATIRDKLVRFSCTSPGLHCTHQCARLYVLSRSL
eukprot:COSAG01_NODE_6285_length_3753_cov_7.145047_6_plen_55_part_00